MERRGRDRFQKPMRDDRMERRRLDELNAWPAEKNADSYLRPQEPEGEIAAVTALGGKRDPEEGERFGQPGAIEPAGVDRLEVQGRGQFGYDALGLCIVSAKKERGAAAPEPAVVHVLGGERVKTFDDPRTGNGPGDPFGLREPVGIADWKQAGSDGICRVEQDLARQVAERAGGLPGGAGGHGEHDEVGSSRGRIRKLEAKLPFKAVEIRRLRIARAERDLVAQLPERLGERAAHASGSDDGDVHSGPRDKFRWRQGVRSVGVMLITGPVPSMMRVKNSWT